MRPWKVDVPVRVQVWNRPDCQRRQFEVLREAAPSILFLTSDGGRTSEEMKLILESRSIMNEIDWDCEIHKLYSEENQGLYAFGTATSDYIWKHVDRCIFLEDDYVPAVSFFQYCAELLEKYKNDERIEMITGNNPFGVYEPAACSDYFFSEVGWSIWGTALWRRTAANYQYPLPYAEDGYVKECLKKALPPFWWKKANGYCRGELVDKHVPGSEYYHAINSALYHRLSIIPTRNLICNIGYSGEHFHFRKNAKRGAAALLNVPVHELAFPLKHPDYVIDDKNYGEMYLKLLGHDLEGKPLLKAASKAQRAAGLLIDGDLLPAIKRKLSRQQEK